jgi:hypothetical protein
MLDINSQEVKSKIEKGDGRVSFILSQEEQVMFRDGGNDAIQLEINRDYNGGWKFTPKVDSWLRYADDKYIIPAWKVLSEKLNQAIQLAENLEENKHKVEGIFQIAEKARREQKAKEEAEAKLKYDADKPVGMKLAKQIIGHMKAKAKNEGASHSTNLHISMADRGTRKERNLWVKFSWGGKTLFSTYEYGGIVARTKAMAFLADTALDALKVDGVQFVDPKLAKFMLRD